jgi:hypothetical protein
MRFRACFLAVWFFCIASGQAREVVFIHYNLENYLSMSRKVGNRTVPDAPKPEKEVRALVSAVKSLKPTSSESPRWETKRCSPIFRSAFARPAWIFRTSSG